MKKKTSKQIPWVQFHDMHSAGYAKICRDKDGSLVEGSRFDKRNLCEVGMIYIQASKDEAEIIFYNRFGHSPNRVTCTCCGEDYSLTESPTLEQATAYNRGCSYVYRDSKGKEVKKSEAWVPGRGLKKGCTGGYEERQNEGRFSFGRKYITLKEYITKPEVFVIYDKDIKPEERVGEVPRQGFVWVD